MLRKSAVWRCYISLYICIAGLRLNEDYPSKANEHSSRPLILQATGLAKAIVNEGVFIS